MGFSCQNLPNADPICSYIQGWLSRNLGMAGEHCSIPNNPVMTGEIQTACPKTCCQCQGKLRCEHYIDLFGGPQMGSSRKDPRPAGGRSGDAGLLNPQPLEDQVKFEDPFQKAIAKHLKLIMEPFRATNDLLWKPNHQ